MSARAKPQRSPLPIQLRAGARADAAAHVHLLPARVRRDATPPARERTGHAPAVPHLVRAGRFQPEREHDGRAPRRGRGECARRRVRASAGFRLGADAALSAVQLGRVEGRACGPDQRGAVRGEHRAARVAGPPVPGARSLCTSVARSGR
jgi:hypothetical protein